MVLRLTFLVKLEFGNVGFEGWGKAESLGKNLSVEGEN